MNKNFEEREETDFNEWLSKMYWEWHFAVYEPLASAIEKRVLAALLGQPVEKLAEIRKLI